MTISDKQKELDKIKWEKSCRLGFDACGSFDYCKCCDKGMENPCEKAHNKFFNIPVADEHELVVEISTDDSLKVETPKTRAKTSCKKSTKSTSKKSTTKKTCKK